jgi:class 3 adenylate cyclase/tetratricopeptide (TPR) repeat protein
MKCPNCRTTNPDQAKFCMNCGAALAQAPEKPGSLDRFIPRELQAKFEAARAQQAMAGERRVVTMLFCDVKGSTAAAEKVDPEVWTDIMNGVFEHMIRPIYKYEGLVPRLMGDAILAFFGAPIAHEDDPQRAVLAGLEIQEGIKPYAEETRRKHGLEFGLRVGINTGLVVVGEIGSDLRMEYTAIGDAINLAARMEQTAEVGTIQISEATYKLVAPFFEVEPLGEVDVKGKAEPVKTFRVLSEKATRGNLRGLEGLSSPLVGREAQLNLLNEQLGQLEKESGSIVGVIGEAGLGKSTLISEFKKSSDAKSCAWLKGDALSYARSISYFPWRQIIRQSIDAHEGDAPAQIREKLRYTCDCCTLPGGDIPFLEAMLAVESEESLQVITGYQGDALIQRIVDAVRGYFCGLASEGPLVIVFDDLHWADEASLNLFLNLADLVNDQKILFICVARPDKQAASWDFMQKLATQSNGRYHSIQLQPLQAEQTDTLLTNLLGMQSLPKSLRDLIVEKAEGNPFFIEELIRSLIETKQIVREKDHWKAVNIDAKISLPTTLRGVLSARIDHLPETARHVLQNAAVIGRSFDLRVLKRLTALNGVFDMQIRVLQEASLIEPAREEYSFRHVLIQEAAYDSILMKKRVDLHKQIGQSLEELQADRIEEFAPVLAHHFYTGQDERSLKYDLLAGDKAARLYANPEAATHYGRALEVAKRRGREKSEVIEIFSKLGGALELSGRYEQALTTYEELQAFGREQKDRSIELKALLARATIYSIFSQMHNSALGEQMLLEALEISNEIGDRATQAKLNWNLMLTYLFSKRFEPALKHGKLALPLARESGDREQLAFVLNDLCRLHTCMGKFEEARASIHEARELWKSLDHQVMLADSFGSEAEALLNSGKFDESLEYTQQGLAIVDRIENLWGQSYQRMLIAFVHLEKGQFSKCMPLALQSTETADRAGLIASSIGVRSELGLAYVSCGDFDRGLALIERAHQVAEEKQPAWSVFPQAAKVRAHLLHGDISSAQKIAGDVLLEPISIPYARYTIFLCMANIELAVSTGRHEQALKLIDDLLDEVLPLTRVDIPEVLRRKGDALFALGRLDEAHQVLTEACSMARGMGANPQLWPILASLSKVNSKMGNEKEAGKNIEQARRIIEQIAEDLREIGLRESFLNRPQVQAVMQQ